MTPAGRAVATPPASAGAGPGTRGGPPTAGADAVATLPVAECFGPTLQGEGPAAGRAAHFVRLMGCNLSCGWCDTPYTWHPDHELRAGTEHLTADAIMARLGPRPGLLVLTGGEPLLHQRQPAWRQLLERAVAAGWRVDVETNGTVAPDAEVLAAVAASDGLISVSPKMAHAGPHRGRQDPRLSTAWLGLFGLGHAGEPGGGYPQVIVKVVVRDAADVAAVATAYLGLGLAPGQVWVMPEGTTPEALAARWAEVAQAAADHGVNATHRLHVLAWGAERGR